jgi:hypothetical protein
MDVTADVAALQVFAQLLQLRATGEAQNEGTLRSLAQEAYRCADQFMLVKVGRDVKASRT